MDSAHPESSSNSSDLDLDELWSDLDFILGEESTTKPSKTLEKSKKKGDKVKIKIKFPSKILAKEKYGAISKTDSESAKKVGEDDDDDKKKSDDSEVSEKTTKRREIDKLEASTKTDPKRKRTGRSESDRKIRHQVQREKINSSIKVMKVKVPGCINVRDMVLLLL